MHILLSGVFLLLTAFLVHLVVWRFRMPRNHTLGLLTIFCVTPFALSLIIKPALTWDIVHVGIFYTSCALVYIIFYSLIEAESPTLSIISRLRNATPEGCTLEAFEESFGNNSLLKQRAAAMVKSGLIVPNNSGYTLTHKGRLLASVFAYAAQVIGLGRGG